MCGKGEKMKILNTEKVFRQVAQSLSQQVEEYLGATI